MKKLLRNLSFLLFALLLVINCATTNYNYFQDGKPSGKNQGKTILGLNVGTYVDYDISDEEGKTPEINIGKTVKMELFGRIENMSGLACPHCGEMVNLFGSGEGREPPKKRAFPFSDAFHSIQMW